MSKKPNLAETGCALLSLPALLALGLLVAGFILTIVRMVLGL